MENKYKGLQGPFTTSESSYNGHTSLDAPSHFAFAEVVSEMDDGNLEDRLELLYTLKLLQHSFEMYELLEELVSEKSDNTFFHTAIEAGHSTDLIDWQLRAIKTLNKVTGV